jgi:hypothetical protein
MPAENLPRPGKIKRSGELLLLELNTSIESFEFNGLEKEFMTEVKLLIPKSITDINIEFG